jgi:hypothetical protein
MASAEAIGEELVGTIDRDELRLPEIRHRYVGRYISCLLDGLLLGALAPYMAQEEAA